MISSLDLHGHVSVITGGNSGIGLGIAEALMQSGASVCIWGTNEERNERAASELDSRHEGRALSIRCDVGDEDAVEDSFAQAVDELGGVDSCFANAGVNGIGVDFLDLAGDEWRRLMRINLDGAFFTLRAAARHMVKRGAGGSLICVSSVGALEGQARGQHYGASKAGMLGLMRGLAVELAPHGIRSNAVLPGWVETPLAEPLLSLEKFRDRTIPRIPARRFGTPADLGGIAVYLA